MRQWHWYVLQVVTFCVVWWYIFELTKPASLAGENFGHAPGMAAAMGAFAVSYGLGKVIDLFSYIGRRLKALIREKRDSPGQYRRFLTPRWHLRHDAKQVPGPRVRYKISDFSDPRS